MYAKMTNGKKDWREHLPMDATWKVPVTSPNTGETIIFIVDRRDYVCWLAARLHCTVHTDDGEMIPLDNFIRNPWSKSHAFT